MKLTFSVMAFILVQNKFCIKYWSVVASCPDDLLDKIDDITAEYHVLKISSMAIL